MALPPARGLAAVQFLQPRRQRIERGAENLAVGRRFGLFAAKAGVDRAALEQRVIVGQGQRIDARPSSGGGAGAGDQFRSEEHTSELQSLMRISYAVFCLKKK